MKRLLRVILVSITIVGVMLLFIVIGDKNNEILSPSSELAKVNIAVCPTFVNHLDGLDNNIFTIVPTLSTSESIALLNEGRVNIALSGRILKPEEPVYESVFLGNGFSFLSDREITLKTDELSETAIYTDLDKSEISKYFALNNISQVSDVYNYIDGGIVVTSWENTDYARAEIVHVINEDGSRNVNSRIPVLYYKEGFNKELLNLIIESVKKYAKR